jgi:ABC-type multidrug transport system fused ATPase/permease subunit
LNLLAIPAVDAARRVWRILPGSDRRAWIAATALGLVFALLEAATALAVLVLVAALTPTTAVSGFIFRAVDALRLHLAPNLDPASFAALMLLGIVTLSLCTNTAHVYLEGRLTTRAYVWSGVKLLRTYLSADYVWFHQQNSADFIRNIQESANLFASNVLLPASRMVREAMVFLAVCTIGLIARPELALVAVLFVIIYVAIHWLPSRLATRLGKSSERIKRDQQQSLLEAFEFFDEARISGLIEPYVQRFARPRQQYRRIQVFRQLNEVIPARAAEWAVLALLVAAIVVLGESLRHGELRDYWAQTLVFALYLAYRLRANLSALLANVVFLRFGWAAFANVERGLQIPVGFLETAYPIKLHRSLELADVTFIYPGGEGGIRNIDLEIQRGQWIGLAGRSGAGKTTLVAMIIGLLRPQTGKIAIDGHEARLDQPGWYQRIGYVSQRIALLDGSLRTNITMEWEKPCDDGRLACAVAQAHLEPVVATLPGGLDGRIGERGSLLSGGQRQRVALARALYRQSDLLILDEATSSLDSDTEAAFLESLEELRGQITVVAISHRQAVLDRCDCVVRLEGGRIASMKQQKASGRANQPALHDG